MSSTTTSRTPSFRHATPHQLAEALLGARNYTLRLFDCLAGAGYDASGAGAAHPHRQSAAVGAGAYRLVRRMVHPARGGVEPSRRRPAPSLLTRGDDWFDSNNVPHRSRWTRDLPSPARSRPTAAKCSTACSTSSPREAGHRRGAVPVPAGAGARRHAWRSAVVHDADARRARCRPQLARDERALSPATGISLSRRHHGAGRRRTGGFVFDNEKRAHQCYVAPFDDRCGTGDQRPVRRIHGRRRLPGQQVLERGGARLADAAGTLVAALLAARRRPVARAALRAAVDAGAGRAGAPCQPVRGAGLLRLDRPAPADRGGMGIRGDVGTGRLSVGAVVGMDGQSRSSRIPALRRTATANTRSRGS